MFACLKWPQTAETAAEAQENQRRVQWLLLLWSASAFGRILQLLQFRHRFYSKIEQDFNFCHNWIWPEV